MGANNGHAAGALSSATDEHQTERTKTKGKKRKAPWTMNQIKPVGALIRHAVIMLSAVSYIIPNSQWPIISGL